MASALIDTPTKDLDQALALARAAMAAGEGNRIESIEQRLRSFVAGLQGYSDYAPVAAFADEVRQWLCERKSDNDNPF
ncbi:hypothetical protein OOK41_03500 [Micromonospora sp. NBC_01655]|uniref:hypothetical protein n=1 Tax=Micromonospora sp. NBC_01655 TaxID=2975983 RepID=UPI00224ED691|nr:hypothetical protein [Micromonospora sp. NBC_01655]MCX4469384.1 hypothetical protein [Micromonospora sp. NBC_01655]